jgi:ribosomal protein S18 acetylase RimI-like enzyme
MMPPGQDTLVRSILYGGVHPDFRGRGIGRAIMAWEEARGLEQLAGSDKPLPGWLGLYSDERAESERQLAIRFGYQPTRWFQGQQRMLAEPVPPRVPPAGIRIVPFSSSFAEAARLVKNAAYRDHWGNQPASAEHWAEMLTLPSVRAELAFLAMTEANEVVGVVITDVIDGQRTGREFSSGYVGYLGVLREWRRKGIASALLACALQSFRQAGLERAELDVDSDSPTGGVDLYSSMGFYDTTGTVALMKVY